MPKPFHRILIRLLILLHLPSTILATNICLFNLIPDSIVSIVLLEPAGDSVDNLPVMTRVADTTELYNKVMKNIHSSFINDFLDLNFILQLYLVNTHRKDSVEPAYLALTSNQGGFARTGFVLSENGNQVRKPSTPYVDITRGQATSNMAGLMSVTQLYPHECGHVFIHLLCPEDSIESNTRSVDMHYFSIVTDYSTAFNEGFSEHLENLSRLFEKNDSIRAGIEKDTEEIRNSSARSIQGFKRDFYLAARLGFYKASMLGWYQRFEDYKRYVQALNGDVRYNATEAKLRKTEDRLTYRNSAVETDTNSLRNQVQLHATEGAVSAFFTRLLNSGAGEHYLEPDFYRAFMYDTTGYILDPPARISPVENLFMKYFTVLDKYVVINNSESSQLADFIEGYIREFPAEEKIIKQAFRESLGSEYSGDLPPPLWLMVKGHNHRLLVLDPFDAITVPVYTFDLNAARVADLLTLPGVTGDEARLIINYRETNGFYTSLEDLKNVPGISTDRAASIQSAVLDLEYLETLLNDYEPKLSISMLVRGPLTYIFSRAGLWFILLFGFLFYSLKKQNILTTKLLISRTVKYIFLWILFVLAGLVSVFITGQTFTIMTLFTLFVVLITFLVFRRKKPELIRTLVMTTLMFVLVSISLV